MQEQYRRHLEVPQTREHYRTMRENVRTPDSVSGALERCFLPWWQENFSQASRTLLRLLDIGTGDGVVLQAAIDWMYAALGLGEYGQAVQAAAEPLREPQIAIRATSLDPAFIPTEDWSLIRRDRATIVEECTFEDWPASNEEFDLVLAVHSLYLIDPSYLKKIYDLLSDFGMAIIVHAPFADNILNTITGVVDASLMQNRRNFRKEPYPGKVVAQAPLRIFAEDVLDESKRLFGDAAVECIAFEKSIPLSVFVTDADEPTDVAKAATSFFAEPLQPVTAELLSRVVKACKELTTDDGRAEMRNREYGIIIRKSKVRNASIFTPTRDKV